jgi:hypothetical protein
MDFSGFVQLGDTLVLFVLITDSSSQPIEPDAAPTFRIYGPSGLLPSAGGTCTPAHTGTVTAASNASPIAITSGGHGLATGQIVTISGVSGNTAANGTFTITKVDADHYTLNGSTGNGNYTSGGTWRLTGLYKATVPALGGSGFESNETYVAHLAWLASSSPRAATQSFGVT